jgi:hypothetical protein
VTPIVTQPSAHETISGNLVSKRKGKKRGAVSKPVEVQDMPAPMQADRIQVDKAAPGLCPTGVCMVLPPAIGSIASMALQA